jgi:hypothetical protein
MLRRYAIVPTTQTILLTAGLCSRFKKTQLSVLCWNLHPDEKNLEHNHNRIPFPRLFDSSKEKVVYNFGI